MATASRAAGPNRSRLLPFGLVCGLWLAWPAARAQQGTAAEARSVAPLNDAGVRRIDRERAAIDRRLPRTRKAAMSVLGCSLEGAAVTTWAVDDKVLRLDATVYGETYRGTYRFYYRDGEPIFVSGKLFHYHGTFGKVISTESHRLYLERDEAVRVTTPAGKALARDDAARVQADVAELSRCLLLRMRE